MVGECLAGICCSRKNTNVKSEALSADSAMPNDLLYNPQSSLSFLGGPPSPHFTDLELWVVWSSYALIIHTYWAH